MASRMIASGIHTHLVSNLVSYIVSVAFKWTHTINVNDVLQARITRSWPSTVGRNDGDVFTRLRLPFYDRIAICETEDRDPVVGRPSFALSLFIQLLHEVRRDASNTDTCICVTDDASSARLVNQCSLPLRTLPWLQRKHFREPALNHLVMGRRRLRERNHGQNESRK